MRAPALPAILLSVFFLGRVVAVEKSAPAATGPTFSLTPVESQPSVSKFSGAQLAAVQSWIKQKAPECPLNVSATVADLFLDDLQRRDPTKMEQLLSPDFPWSTFESMLLRQVGAKLTGASQGSAREEIARRRVGTLLATEGREPKAALGEAAGLLAKIKDASPAQYRRVVEGRMEDDDLQLMLKKVGESGAAPKAVVAAKPKVLTAADIVAEFSRRNQVGAAQQHLHAYVVEGRIKTAAGEEQELLLFKMRPDRFRVMIRKGGATRYILAGDGDRFWQQVPGQAPQPVPATALGQRRYLAEFADPLFADEGYTFERLEDGAAAGKKFHRIAVRRTDGTSYVAHVDGETFRETGRENEDHSVASYADFREVGGITYAFREEITDSTGRKGEFVVTRIAPNPGLIQALFTPPTRPELGYLQLEGFLTPASNAPAPFNR